jgi:HD-GYP domain-containing protein (c-di-GMP phosphodiesterase class II)
MTSERPYKAALSHDFACRGIQASAGTQFDPLLSAVFLLDHVAFHQMRTELKL